jgi:hypothetical protein
MDFFEQFCIEDEVHSKAWDARRDEKSILKPEMRDVMRSILKPEMWDVMRSPF